MVLLAPIGEAHHRLFQTVAVAAIVHRHTHDQVVAIVKYIMIEALLHHQIVRRVQIHLLTVEVNQQQQVEGRHHHHHLVHPTIVHHHEAVVRHQVHPQINVAVRRHETVASHHQVAVHRHEAAAFRLQAVVHHHEVVFRRQAAVHHRAEVVDPHQVVVVDAANNLHA